MISTTPQQTVSARLAQSYIVRRCTMLLSATAMHVMHLTIKASKCATLPSKRAACALHAMYSLTGVSVLCVCRNLQAIQARPEPFAPAY